MNCHPRALVVVETAALEQRVVHPETKRFNQVQVIPRIGTEPDQVAGVRRDLRVDQHNVHQPNGTPRRRGCPRDRTIGVGFAIMVEW